jgi:hypothetical protein
MAAASLRFVRKRARERTSVSSSQKAIFNMVEACKSFKPITSPVMRRPVKKAVAVCLTGEPPGFGRNIYRVARQIAKATPPSKARTTIQWSNARTPKANLRCLNGERRLPRFYHGGRSEITHVPHGRAGASVVVVKGKLVMMITPRVAGVRHCSRRPDF